MGERVTLPSDGNLPSAKTKKAPGFRGFLVYSNNRYEKVDDTLAIFMPSL